MGNFIATAKALWEAIKLAKQIFNFFKEIRKKELDEEQKKRETVRRMATEVIEAEGRKPVEDRNNTTIMDELRNKNKSE